MNILICDDIPVEGLALEKLLLSSGFQVNIKQFHHASAALDFIAAGAKIDLCFLDIIMPEITGVELAQALRQKGYSGEIVFLSTSKEYGPESYTVGAFSYLLKPPDPESIKELLTRLEQTRASADQAGILIKTAGKTKHLLYRNISHAEVMKHTVYFRLTDGGEVCVNTTFSEIAGELLKEPRFIQCHRSYIVNMDDIAEISEDELVTQKGRRIPISRNYRDTHRLFYKWKFGGECP